jgi:hypothetical protein
VLAAASQKDNWSQAEKNEHYHRFRDTQAKTAKDVFNGLAADLGSHVPSQDRVGLVRSGGEWVDRVLGWLREGLSSGAIDTDELHKIRDQIGTIRSEYRVLRQAQVEGLDAELSRPPRPIPVLTEDQVREYSRRNVSPEPMGRATEEPATETVPAETPQVRHSTDFSEVEWFGVRYTFTKTQALAVSEWWTARENKTPAVRDETVITEIGSQNNDKTRALRDLFKGHPAWGTMIVPGPRKGTHQLDEPVQRK